MGRKLALTLFGEAGSSSNAMWPGSKPTSMSSFILIHPPIFAIIHQRHRQTGQTDDGPIAYGEPLYKRSARNASVSNLVCSNSRMRKQGLNADCLKILFHSIVLSKILYAVSAWGGYISVKNQSIAQSQTLRIHGLSSHFLQTLGTVRRTIILACRLF